MYEVIFLVADSLSTSIKVYTEGFRVPVLNYRRAIGCKSLT